MTPNIPIGKPDNCYDTCDLERCLNDQGEAPVLNCPKPDIVGLSMDSDTMTTPNTDSVADDYVTFVDEGTTNPPESMSTPGEVDLDDTDFYDDTNKPSSSTPSSTDDDYYDRYEIPRPQSMGQSESLQFVEL